MRIILIVSICLLFLSVGAFSKLATPAREYKFDYNVGERRANQLATEGWELVAIGAPGSGPTSNVQTFVFKRAR